jgi:hypothetical protein
MQNFTERHNELFIDVLNALENTNPLSFKYKDDGIYELPRISAVNKYNTYCEYAIIKFNAEILTAISLDDESERIFNFYDLTLAEAIDLYEYIHEYITQSN